MLLRRTSALFLLADAALAECVLSRFIVVAAVESEKGSMSSRFAES